MYLSYKVGFLEGYLNYLIIHIINQLPLLSRYFFNYFARIIFNYLIYHYQIVFYSFRLVIFTVYKIKHRETSSRVTLNRIKILN